VNPLTRSHDPVVVGVHDRGRAVAQVEFDKDAADVALDGDTRNAEFVGDLGVGATLGDQRQHVEFARREVDGRVVA
jgi:hypothetical protein